MSYVSSPTLSARRSDAPRSASRRSATTTQNDTSANPGGTPNCANLAATGARSTRLAAPCRWAIEARSMDGAKMVARRSGHHLRGTLACLGMTLSTEARSPSRARRYTCPDQLTSAAEVSGYLVGSPAFKAGGRGDPTTAGSIPVHLRQRFNSLELRVTVAALGATVHQHCERWNGSVGRIRRSSAPRRVGRAARGNGHKGVSDATGHDRPRPHGRQHGARG